jgi:ubiquinone/menaquinone biosynthesis C-methylase UbiE
MSTPDTRWTHFFWNYWLYRVPKVDTVLDVCSGRGIVGAMCQIYLGIDADAIEIHAPSALFSSQYYRKVEVGDALDALYALPDESYDMVVCFDAIEHFTKERALQVLNQMERIAKKVVFVSSVNWFYEQPEYDGNPFQNHLCLLTSREIERLGYTTRGFGYRSKYAGSVLFRRFLRHYETGYLAWKDFSK